MKDVKSFTVFAVVCLLSAIGCMNGGGSNSGDPIVTTPSGSSSANSAASTAVPATNGNLSIMDSSYNSDTMRTDTVRK